MPVYCGSSQPPSGRWVSHQPARRRADAAGVVACPAASSASSAHAVCDAVDVPRPIQRRVAVGAQVLAPAAVGVLVRGAASRRAADDGRVVPGRRRRPARARPRRCRRRGWRPTGRTRSRPPPARASSQRHRARTGSTRPAPRGASISTTCAVTSALRRVDHRAEVAERQLAGELAGVVGVERAPAAVRGTACRAARPTPAVDRRLARPGDSRSRRSAEHAPRRCRRCRGSCRCRTRTPSRPAARSRPAHRPVAADPDLLGQQPVARPAPAPGRRRSRRRRRARSRPARCPRPATGTPPAGVPARPGCPRGR